jgi:hypothetical protein
MDKMQLTPQQLAFMDTFGYLHFPGLMSDCIDKIIEEFEAVFAKFGGGHHGKPHDGTARSCIVPFIDQNEYLSGLLDDPRIDGIFSSLLGDDYNYLGSDGNYYVGDTGWHSDGGWPRPIVYYKLALYLEPLTRHTGALRVIPGSHKYGDKYAETLQKVVSKSPEVWGMPGNQVPAVALETKPGDVIVFHQGLKHSSWGGGKRRRMFTLNCSPRHTPEQLHLVRDEISAFARFWVDSVYGEAMLRTASPKRMRHLEQALANQDHLSELSRKAKERMAEPSRG